jgi:hypothetical protein
MQILPVLSTALDVRNSVVKLRRVLGCLGDVARAEEAARMLPAAACAKVDSDVLEVCARMLGSLICLRACLKDFFFI